MLSARDLQLTLVAATEAALPVVALDDGVDDVVGSLKSLVGPKVIQGQTSGQVMQHLQVSQELKHLGVTSADFHCLQCEGTILVWGT